MGAAQPYTPRHRGFVRAYSEKFGMAAIIRTSHDKLARIEIPVIGLDCQACALATYEVIYKIDGVAAATVDYKEGRVTALIDSSKTTQPALEDALTKREVKFPPKK